MMAASVKADFGVLREIAKNIDNADSFYLKVGILGATNARREKVVYAPRPGQKNKRGLVTQKFSRGLTIQNAKGKLSHIGAGYLNNAEIGAIHEFGSPGKRVPERSFLRMPIMTRLDDELRSVPIGHWQDLFVVRGLEGVLWAIGQAAYNVVIDTFKTGGFGRWKKLKAATIRRKGSPDILRDTNQLMRSISFAVVAKGSA